MTLRSFAGDLQHLPAKGRCEWVTLSVLWRIPRLGRLHITGQDASEQ